MSQPPAPAVPVIGPKDLVFYYSGGYYNSDPASSLGGDISTYAITSGKINGLFDSVGTVEALSGDVEYRCIYLKNTNQTRKLLGAKIWIETGTQSNNTAIAIAIGSAGINGVEPQVPTENIAPPMEFFEIPLQAPDIPNIGDLWPGDKIGLWIRWIVKPATAPIADDFAVIRIDGEREPESLTSPLPDTEEPGECSAGNHWDPVTQQCIADTIPITCPTGYAYNESTQRCEPTAVPPPSIALLKFGAVGDTYPGTDSQEVFAMFNSRLNLATGTDTSFLIFSGDATHIDGDVSDFVDYCRTLGAMFPDNIFPALGNHDDGEDGASSDGEDVIAAFPAMSDTGYYAVTRRNIRIIILNTQASFSSSSAQATWVRTQLEQATADPAIKWKILVFHKPIVTSDGYHAPEEELRDWLWPLMDTHHVDMIFSGHNHVYTRTKTLKYNSSDPMNPIITVDQASGNYINQDGRMFFVDGTGGRSSNREFAEDTAEPYVAYRRLPPPYGAIVMTLQDNGNQIAGEYVTQDNQVMDSWILSKPGATPPPPGGTPTCPEGYFWDQDYGQCLISPKACPTGQHWDKYQQRCVSDIVTPPPTSPGYPVLNVVWYYESTQLQATTATITAGQHDATGGIVLCSNESGVTSMGISGGYINVEAGAGLGRIYFDYHLRDRYDDDTLPGFNIGMAFSYVYEGQASILVQDGNHPVTGFSVGGQTNYQFGGFNFTLYPNQIRSFAEYYHELNGDPISSVYPGNRTLVSGRTYKCFFTLRTNKTNESVILNVWQDFADGYGWVKIMSDRTWSQSNWLPGNVPTGVDELQVEQGPSYIQRHHVLLGNNGTGPDLKLKDVKIGYLPFLPEGTNPPPPDPPPPPPPSQGEMDTNGIYWFVGRGTTHTISQSRTATNDFRWSANSSEVRQTGYESTAYFTFDGVASGGHFAQKIWGGNHSGDCQYEEDGACCCWYDLGIRANGDIQRQIERPHPNNDDFSLPSGGVQHMDNIGKPMEGNTIGLKWVIFPVIPGGTADDGSGIHIKMWTDTSGFNAQGRPQNNWRLVFDFIDKGTVLGDYDAPDEVELEIRNSDTDNTDDYAGGFQWRTIPAGGGDGGGGDGGGGNGGGNGGGGTIPPGTAFKFNVAGDFRAGQDAEDTAANLVASPAPNVIFFVGDYAIGDATEEDWCNNIMAPVKNSGIPVWGCTGNHDNNDYLTVNFFENTSWSWRVNYGNIAFIGADTIAENVSATQTLCAAAQADSTINRIVIFMHESVFKQTGGGTSGSDTTIEFHNMFKTFSKLKLVIAGHSHNYTRFAAYEGIIYIINEDGGQQPDSNTGCMKCSVDAAGSITCTMNPNTGGTLDNFTIGADGSLPGGGTLLPVADGMPLPPYPKVIVRIGPNEDYDANKERKGGVI